MPKAEKMAGLKLCPFCRNEAHLVKKDGLPGWSWWRVVCSCCLIGTDEYPLKSAAIKAWNRRAEVSNRPLILEELRKLPEKEWVWIECLEPIPYTNGSAYYCKIAAIRPEVMFECGYPGWGTALRYENYGKTWLAYHRRPEEAER